MAKKTNKKTGSKKAGGRSTSNAATVKALQTLYSRIRATEYAINMALGAVYSALNALKNDCATATQKAGGTVPLENVGVKPVGDVSGRP
jgi:hypothetical protein